jgi:nitroreductase
MTTVQTHEDLFEIVSSMRAIRRLKPDPVPREVLEKIVEAATMAPSGGNTQTYHYVVVDDRATIARLAPMWRRLADFYLTPLVGHPPPTTSAEQLDRMIAAARYLADHFEELPALLVACLDAASVRKHLIATLPAMSRSFVSLGLPHAPIVARNFNRFQQRTMAASIMPGVQNALLAARALGLGASLTTWHLLFEQEFKRMLGIPGSIDTYAAIPVGYPRGRIGPVRRRPLEESLHWNCW